MRPSRLALCGALLLTACATKGDEMRVVVPLKTTYLDAEAVDGGTVDVPPRVLEEVRPTAPAGIGRDPAPSAVVRFSIDAEGRINDVEVVRATDDRLAGPATEAISRWKLRPAQRDGRGVPAVATVLLTFDQARSE